MNTVNRREFLGQSLCLAGGLSLGLNACSSNSSDILIGVKDFIRKIANPDGTFRPGIDPRYEGNSDTKVSDLAAPAYATILSSTFGWSLPYPDQTVSFLRSSQKPDGTFYAPNEFVDPNSPLIKLYNTVQGTLTLRLLGKKPDYDPTPVIEFFFEDKQFEDLPLYTTSFFPLFYTALGQKMPRHIDEKMFNYIVSQQKDDGYLQNHVATSFHAAHYCRLTGRPTPKAIEMVQRVVNDQKEDGSWHLMEPDWDVHACFDALFILNQLGDKNAARIKKAKQKATDWILKCKKPDGGFSHFPYRNISDMDAVYFHIGGLVETGFLKTKKNLKNEEILGWGHAMNPGKIYSCL